MLSSVIHSRTTGHVRPISGFVRPDIKPDITGFPPTGEPGMSGVPVLSAVRTAASVAERLRNSLGYRHE